MRKLLFLSLFFLSQNDFFAQQQQVYLHFIPNVAGDTLFGQTIVQDLNDIEMSIDYFNYYLSNLHIIHDSGQDLDLSDSVFLVKMDNYILDLGLLDISTVSQINFGIGVPYDLNHLDISQYSLDHPLSFQNPSMQWGWTSGYSHMIVGGLGDNDNDGIPETNFEIHNLGDNNYKNVLLPASATQTESNRLDIFIYCNLDEWIYGANPGDVGIKHGSSGINSTVMGNVNNRSVFETQASLSAGIDNKNQTKGILKSYNTENTTKVNWSELNDASNFALIDMSGKTIETGKMNNKKGEVFFSNLSNGSYVFIAYTENGEKLNQLRIVK